MWRVFSPNPVATCVHPFAAKSTTVFNEKFRGNGYISQISTAGKGPLSH